MGADMTIGERDMTLRELEELLAIYGADRRRWPERAGARAEALVATNAAARRLQDAAAALDKVMAAAPRVAAARMPALADAYGLTDWFASRGVSKDQAHACLARTDQIQAIAAQTQKWSTDDGIDQTPTIFINGAKTDIAEWAQLEPALQNAGAR